MADTVPSQLPEDLSILNPTSIKRAILGILNHPNCMSASTQSPVESIALVQPLLLQYPRPISQPCRLWYISTEP